MKDLFDRYTSFDRTGDDGTRYTTQTRLIRVERHAVRHLADAVRDVAEPGPVAVVFDAITRGVAGADAVDALREAGFDVAEILLVERDDETTIVCDDARIVELEGLLDASGARHAVAVGAGTINDVVKMASFRLGFGYTSLGTAPSMNGYTSSIAAILSNGVKTTQPCHAPLAALADIDVMANAPYRMIASGIGDLYSKPVSNADWRLSHRLLGTPHSTIVMEIVEAGSTLLEGVAPRLPERDPDAVAALTGALMMSGLAMQAAGTSGPASGGEHLISHFIDMTSIAFGESHDFHGCQVAVGTITTSRLYEEVRQMDPRSIDIEARVAAHPEWEQYEPVLVQRFGPLADAVLAHARKMYPTREQVRARLDRLVEEWDSIMEDVGGTLRGSKVLADELSSADCPIRFPQIDVAADRARRSIAHSKDIRARYTILHLASELGILDEFADSYVDESFAT